MSRALSFARENGVAQLLPRMAVSAMRRLRDGLTAAKLLAPGFRAGRAPRLLGLSHMRVGKDFRAGDQLWLESVVEYGGQRFKPKLSIGDGATLSDSVHIACLNSITIGAGLLSGSRVLISDHAHGSYHPYENQDEQSSPDTRPVDRPLVSGGAVVIGKNVWLGDGVAVLAGATIGDGAVIGANSVVTGAIPAGTIAVGSPARPIRRWDPEARAWRPLAG